MLNGLDLFSGIGGLALALEEWVKPVLYCEIDRYAQAVLLSRMRDGRLPLAPIASDVRELRGDGLGFDIIYGGFPCQDISAAGNGVGLGGERSGLFQHIARLVSEANPRFVFLENVPAIRTRGLNSIVQTFTELGYDCRWTIVSAAEVGAPHLRKRWFLLAHTKSFGSDKGRIASGGEKEIAIPVIGSSEPLGNANGPRSQRQTEHSETWRALAEHRHTSKSAWPTWIPEPSLCRGHHGLSARVDRIRALGNAVVPAQAREAFMRLIGIENEGGNNGRVSV